MNKKSKKTFNAVKLIGACLIFFLLSGVGVMASTTKVDNVTIKLSNGYELKVLTTKTKVADILKENNIIISENEKVIPDLETELTTTNKIVITDKSTQEVEIAKISESGLETTLDSLLKAYNTITEKIEVVEESIPFETVTKDVSDGSSSTKNKVVQNGEDGIKKVTYKVKYQNDVEIERNKISEEIVKEAVDKIVQVQTNIITSRSATTARATSGSVAEYQSYAKSRCESLGWSESDFNCLVILWNKESGWNPYSQNARSGAYGIPQALPASKMASAGSDYKTNYQTQINWGLNYIKSRYGNPTSALNHSQRKGWY